MIAAIIIIAAIIPMISVHGVGEVTPEMDCPVASL